MPKRKIDNDQAKLSFGISGILTLVKPLMAGGPDNESNKQALCPACHRIKTDMERIERAMSFINAGSSDKAFRELSNARMTYTYAGAEIQPKGLALASMVKTIDGQPQTDLTSDGLRRVLTVLQDNGITKQEVDEISEDIKKKSSENSRFSFLTNLKGKMSSIIRR